MITLTLPLHFSDSNHMKKQLDTKSSMTALNRLDKLESLIAKFLF